MLGTSEDTCAALNPAVAVRGLVSSEEEAIQRARVVQVALSWVGTPYHHEARLKGVGIDCATLIAEVFTEAGIVPHIEIPPYSPQWHLHQDEEKYLNFIKTLAGETDGPPLPGDIVVWKFHRCFAHGGIVIEWPTVVHAFVRVGCMLDNAEQNRWLYKVSERVPGKGQIRPKRFLSRWRM